MRGFSLYEIWSGLLRQYVSHYKLKLNDSK
nr:MAG TPA_asm: hypothetical protein [Caudoviricetes sp.]